MADRYKNAPLVELVAEVRWGTGGVVGAPPQGAGPVMVATGQYEEFFMRFGSRLGTLGYDRIERLVPPGFPTLPFQTIYRFRKTEQEQGQGTTLYQVGAGVFSANITPPYHSWKQFRPVVEKGIELLLETRNAAEQNVPFDISNLRYINAFGDKFTKGLSVAKFVQEVLGFKIELPIAVRNEASPNSEIKPLFQLSIPLKIQQQMSLFLTEGIVHGLPAIVMDLTVTNDTSIKPIKGDVMTSFDMARQVIHNVFVGITKELSPIMEPVAEDEL